MSFSKWKIVLDTPDDNPKLGFDTYADALSDTILLSEPRFAVGIFGSWGSGKTTLMKKIRKQISDSPVGKTDIITLEFSAWRYEKEEHLIIPLLDCIRQAVDDWGASNKNAVKSSAKILASTIGKVTYALISGLNLKVGIPGAAEVSFDANKALTQGSEIAKKDEVQKVPRSFYFAAFETLKKAFAEFSKENKSRRIVVFVDDLDRCLPGGALQVLESMKLFFDLQGFVFVVGLDRNVVEWSIDKTYKQEGDEAGKDAPGRVRGFEYIKKIFQVPFALPQITYPQIQQNFIDHICSATELPDGQQQSLNGPVIKHIAFLVTDNGINPREVKRYINAFTIAMKTWPQNRGEPNQDLVLALQTIAFREDWSIVYDTLIGSTDSFLQALNARINENNFSALTNLDPSLISIPNQFINYVSVNEPGHILLMQKDAVPEYLAIGSPSFSSRSDEPLFPPTLLTEQGKFRDFRLTMLNTTLADPLSTDQQTLLNKHLSQLSEFESMFMSFMEGINGEHVSEQIGYLKTYIEGILKNPDVPPKLIEEWEPTVNRHFDAALAAMNQFFKEKRQGLSGY